MIVGVMEGSGGFRHDVRLDPGDRMRAMGIPAVTRRPLVHAGAALFALRMTAVAAKAADSTMSNGDEVTVYGEVDAALVLFNDGVHTWKAIGENTDDNTRIGLSCGPKAGDVAVHSRFDHRGRGAVRLRQGRLHREAGPRRVELSRRGISSFRQAGRGGWDGEFRRTSAGSGDLGLRPRGLRGPTRVPAWRHGHGRSRCAVAVAVPMARAPR